MVAVWTLLEGLVLSLYSVTSRQGKRRGWHFYSYPNLHNQLHSLHNVTHIGRIDGNGGRNDEYSRMAVN
jgi:hypothetical protein